MDLFIGTYTRTTSRGIYRITFDPTSGTLGRPELAAELSSPTWLSWAPGRQTLLAVDADGDGGVTAFAVDPISRRLMATGTQPTGGGSPCHLAVTTDGRLVFSASYARGVVTVYPLADRSRLGPATGRFYHEGRGPHARQQSAHAHGVTLSPDEEYLFVPDLGDDRVFSYHVDRATGTAKRHPAGDLPVAPGAGPRHLSFAPGGEHAYLINELDSTLASLVYDRAEGRLTLQQVLSTLPKNHVGPTTTAEVAVHPAGHSVYGSNRGHDSIVHYHRDAVTGRLTLAGHTPSGGGQPRHFALSPGGDWLIAAHEASDNLTVFSVDAANGHLEATPHSAAVPMPVCVLFDA